MARCLLCVYFSTALQSHNSTSANGHGVIAITQMLLGQMLLISLALKHLISAASHIAIQVGRSRIPEVHLIFKKKFLKMIISTDFLGKEQQQQKLCGETHNISFTGNWLNYYSIPT